MSGPHEDDTQSGKSSAPLFPPSWQGLRQQIVYLAQFGSSIQVIHAEADAGKSTFFSRLLRSGLGSTTIGVTVEEGAGLAAFFRDVLEELGLRPSAEAGLGELVAALRSFVQTLHKERTRAVLLVDDAHYLTDSELGALVSTLQGQADPGVGFHVVLFATPGLAARIDALQVLDVAVHDAALPPFSPAEIHQLLEARAQGAGLVLEQTQRIWYQSGGLPGVALASLEHLRPPPAAEKVMSLRGLPIGHIAALVVLCSVLIWAFLVREVDDVPRNEASPVPMSILPQAEPVPAQPETPPVASPEVELTPSSAEIAPEPTIVARKPDEAGVNLEKVVASGDGRAAPEPVPEPDPPAEPVRPAAPARPQSPVVAPVAADSRTVAEQGATRLLSYPPNAYVLQLMAASAEDKLAAYIAEQPNKLNLHAYKTERDGKVLFILVEGFYADKASAQAAITNLPVQQRNSGPWAKKIEQIQQEIRKSR
ncbi:MAG: AAA family ATPase [Cellvibrionaceae bacterium]|nr:AAA family ATPase [Cellvibrionaceae bacterium]